MLSSRRRRIVVVLTAGLALAAGWFIPPAQASTDPSFDKQWSLTTIGAERAWEKTTGAGVRIGIVDTGIDLRHEDLAGRVVASTSCLDTDGNPLKCEGDAQDDYGHGTHVAGIAGAVKDNGLGVAGI
ncbi:MAG TPA: S8 family serine peptidase, partial [Acidimicrobiia bacterium]|nr:S8 family serine peptidase [Acidimicrobiia bacterium]